MIEVKNGGARKTRSDKKRDVKPTVSINLKSQLKTFAELCGEPTKDVAEKLCLDATTSKVIIDSMAKWFRKNYLYNNTIVVGDAERPKLKVNIIGESDTVTFRLKQNDFDKLDDLAHALDLTPTTTAGVLFKVTLYNVEFMQQYAHDHLMHLTDKQKNDIDVFLNKLWGLKK